MGIWNPDTNAWIENSLKNSGRRRLCNTIRKVYDNVPHYRQKMKTVVLNLMT